MNNSDKSEPQPTFTDAELIAISEEVSSYFPRPISDTIVTLMEVDPYTIYAYWNIEPSTMEGILDTLGYNARQGSLILRVHTILPDAQNSDAGFFDCEVQGMQSNFYIKVNPRTSYVAEIGLLSPDGDFFVLAKSNEVITPPDYQAPRGSEHDDGQDTAPPERQETQSPAEFVSDELLDVSLTNSDETDPSMFLSVSPTERAVQESLDNSDSTLRSDIVNTVIQPLGAFYTGVERAREGFEANAEVRIFGRVNPEKGLTIAGERVTIRPDGSFNHRIPLKTKEDIISLLKIELDES